MNCSMGGMSGANGSMPMPGLNSAAPVSKGAAAVESTQALTPTTKNQATLPYLGQNVDTRA